MGILNVTPDSFSDGGRFLRPEAALAQAERLIREGADILDIGGESSRPGADPVAEAEELRRVIPVIRAVRQRHTIPISVDTVKARVAREALDAGADMINDISALRDDPRMPEVAARARVPVVLMHRRGTPKTMQQDPRYDDVVREIIRFLEERIAFAKRAGLLEENLILDPGIGFGKTTEHNLEILRRLRELEALGRPLLVGTSRKSFIGKLTGVPVEERLPGTIASTLLAVMNGADIVRVHDVAPIKQALTVAEAIGFDLGA